MRLPVWNPPEFFPAMAEGKRGPEINSRCTAVSMILLISQRAPETDVCTATFAKRLKEFLKGWTIFISANHTCLVNTVDSNATHSFSYVLFCLRRLKY